MLIETIPKNNRKDMLYNDIVQLTQSLDIRLPADNFVGKFIKCLTNALWHIDGNHSKINSASLEGKWKNLHTNIQCGKSRKTRNQCFQRES